MVCDGTGQPVGEIGVVGGERQERHHRPQEVFNVFGLGLLTAAGGGFLLFGVTFGGSLDLQVGTNSLDGGCRRPNAS